MQFKLTKGIKDNKINELFKHMEKSPSLVEGARLEIV